MVILERIDFLAKSTLKNTAYKYIKNKIIDCEFEPGTFLDEKKLIEDLGFSRTPIREALNKIEEEGFIQIMPKKGIFVTQITMKSILDVFQIREIIEPAALAKFGQNLSSDKIVHFKALYNKRGFDEEAANEYDDEFHNFLISAYNNAYITNMFMDLQEQNKRVRRMSGKLGNTLDVTYIEHLNILNYLENVELEKAANALNEHISASKRRVLERIF